MSAAVRHRDAIAGDALAIAALHAESWQTTYRGVLRDAYLDADVGAERAALWTERLSTPAANQRVVVAEEDDLLLGFACAYGAEDARWGTELDNLHVRRDAHGRGTGRRLFAEIAAWSRAAHPDVGLYLWVVERNVGARRFYERLAGRDVEGDVWLAPDGGAVPARRYAWSPDVLAALAREEKPTHR